MATLWHGAREAAAAPPSPGFNAYLMVASDYRRRGLSQSRGEPSLQLAGDYQHRSGMFAGAWVATMKYAASPAQAVGRQHEWVYYVGYGNRVEDWSFTGSVGRYTYPDTPHDYDYTEFSGSIGYRDTVFLTVAHAQGLFGRDASALNTELGVAWPLPRAYELGASIGRFDADAYGLRYTHWNAGVSRAFAHRIGLDVRYYGNSRTFSGALATSAGDRWVVSFTYGFRLSER